MEDVVQVLRLASNYDDLHFVAVVGIVMAVAWLLLHMLFRVDWDGDGIVPAGLLALCIAFFAMSGTMYDVMRVAGPLVALALFALATLNTLASTIAYRWRRRKTRS